MPHPSTAPAEADTLRPLAQAIARAHFPAAVKLLFLALLAAFWRADVVGRAMRRPRKDWYPSSRTETGETPESARDSRTVRRLRAWIGWILRGLPAQGMALSGLRALAPSPTRAARAPP